MHDVSCIQHVAPDEDLMHRYRELDSRPTSFESHNTHAWAIYAMSSIGPPENGGPRMRGNTMTIQLDHIAADTVMDPASEAIAAIARGEIVVIVDDEDRENEGDLVAAADHADAGVINFMITHGRGLVCLALPAARAAELELPPHGSAQRGPHGHSLHRVDRRNAGTRRDDGNLGRRARDDDRFGAHRHGK
ncbi:3,4-dihydroxy-2-butanone-4-phosphate synthase [Microbacterium plantarum]|uniref:3,4-dihydroxy-2-butanone-4-phosphate synthase n=1 Tax=Microbacterium plantarum TaxID=1816425 RepID=UPI0038994B13